MSGLPDVASAWLFVDRANLDESSEVSLLASTENASPACCYSLGQIDEEVLGAHGEDQHRAPPTKPRTTKTMIGGEFGLQDELGEKDHGDMSVAYMTAKACYRDTPQGQTR